MSSDDDASSGDYPEPPPADYIDPFPTDDLCEDYLDSFPLDELDVERLDWSFPRTDFFREAPPPFRSRYNESWICYAAQLATKEWIYHAAKSEWDRIDPLCFRLTVFDKVVGLEGFWTEIDVIPMPDYYQEYWMVANAFIPRVYNLAYSTLERAGVSMSTVPSLESDIYPWCRQNILLTYSPGSLGDNDPMMTGDLKPLDPADLGRFDPNPLYERGEIKVSTFTIGWDKFNKEYELDDDGNVIGDAPDVDADRPMASAGPSTSSGKNKSKLTTSQAASSSSEKTRPPRSPVEDERPRKVQRRRRRSTESSAPVSPSGPAVPPLNLESDGHASPTTSPGPQSADAEGDDNAAPSSEDEDHGARGGDDPSPDGKTAEETRAA